MPSIDPRSARDLGWDEFRSRLASYAQGAEAKAALRAMPLLASAEEARASQAILDAYRRAREDEVLGQLSVGVEPVEQVLVRASKKALLEPLEFQLVATCGQLTSALDRALHLLAADDPFRCCFGPLPSLGPLATRIAACFDGEELRDEASDELARLRARRRRLRDRLRASLEAAVQSDGMEEVLQEDFVTQRNGRFVVALNADFKGKLPGIIHGSSHSGRTLFVEPEAFIREGNELRLAESLVHEEEARILRELTEDVAERAEEVRRGYAALVRADQWQAKGNLMADLGARPVTFEKGALCLPRMHHPLLLLDLGAGSVANDLVFDSGQRLMVVSGPNAGGKTVVLSAVALNVLMAHAGLQLCAAEGARVFWAAGIDATLGDHQDLAAGESTFSGHIKRLQGSISRGLEGYLWCIDEIAGGTDPNEGAPIAQAVLEAGLREGAWVLCTTHLERIKAFGLSNGASVAASMELNAEGQPTYRLLMDSIGDSGALRSAERLGLAREVVTRARELLGDGSVLTRAVRRLEDEAAEARRREAEEVETRTHALQEREAVLARGEGDLARRKAEFERVQEAMETRLQALEAAAVEQMRTLQKASMAEAQAALERVREERAALGQDRSAAPASAQETWSAGQDAWVISLGVQSKIRAIEGDEAEVQAGLLRTRVPLSDLAKSRARPSAKAQAPGGSAGAAASSFRIDLRGKRIDEALVLLEKRLDEGVLRGEREVWVTHGIGSGQLKSAVLDALHASPYVHRYYDAKGHQGGPGTTIVELE